MARAALTKTEEVALTSNGLNLTDASFTTMGTGSGNGVTFDYDGQDIVVVKNGTGGPATVTLVIPTSSALSAVGGSVTSPTITVADGKTHVFRLPSVFEQADGKAYIDCDVAAGILVFNL